jgi:hypothetical protein
LTNPLAVSPSGAATTEQVVRDNTTTKACPLSSEVLSVMFHQIPLTQLHRERATPEVANLVEALCRFAALTEYRAK